MLTLSIDNIDYALPESIDEITLGKWEELLNLIVEREYVIRGKTRGGDEVKTEVPIGEESEEFKHSQRIKIAQLFIDLPESFFEEQYELTLFVYETVIKAFNDDGKVKDILGMKFPSLRSIKFAQFVDMENYRSMGVIPFLAVALQKDGEKYNRMHPYFQKKVGLLTNAPAKGSVNYINKFFKELNALKASFPVVFEGTGVTGEKSPNMDKHFDTFKWEEIVRSLATGEPVFNSSKGTLYAVRNANALEVLEYLNIQKAYQAAEYKDMKLRMKPIKK